MKLKNHQSKNVINGALLLTVSTMAVKVLGLIYKVPLSYILSDEGMGYFNTAYSVYAFFYVLCTAGVPKAISVITAENLVNNDSSNADYVCSVAFRMFFIIGIIATGIFIIFANFFANLIGSPNSTMTMIAIAPSIAFVSASGALRGYFSGKINFLPVAVSEVIAGVSKLVFGLIFAYLAYSWGSESYIISAFSILGISIGSFLGFLFLYFVKKRNTCTADKKKILEIKSSLKALKSIFKIAIPLTLTSAIGSLINLIDVGLVMRMLQKDGFTELQANILYGNYTTLVIPMFNLVSTLLAPISIILLPILTKNSVNKNNEEFVLKAKNAKDTVTFLSVPICFVFIYFSEYILKFIFEDSSAVMAAPLLSMIAPAVIFMALTLIFNTAIEAKGNFKLPLISLSLGSVLKVLTSVVLISNPHFSILAAPIGTVVSYGLSFIISYCYLHLKLKIKMSVLVSIIVSVFMSWTATTVVKKCQNSINFFTNDSLKTIFLLLMFAFIYIILVISTFFIYKKAVKYSKIRQKSI